MYKIIYSDEVQEEQISLSEALGLVFNDEEREEINYKELVTNL